MKFFESVFLPVMVVGGIILMAVYDLNVYLGTFLMIGIGSVVYYLNPTSMDELWNMRYVKAGKNADIHDLYSALQSVSIGRWGAPRLAQVTGVRGDAILFETSQEEYYFYIYKTRQYYCIYSTTVKSVIHGHGGNGLSEALAAAGDALDGELTGGNANTSDVQQTVLLLSGAVRSYVQTGAVSFEEQWQQTEAPPKSTVEKKWDQICRSRYFGSYLMLCGAVCLVLFMIVFLREDYADWLAAAALLLLLPAAFALLVWGLFRQIKDWCSKKDGEER